MRIATVKMDVHKLDFPDNHFDTVIDTFGLCSFDDPVKVALYYIYIIFILLSFLICL